MSAEEIIKHLLIDSEEHQHANFLERKVRQLKEKWQHIVTDDLATIRLIQWLTIMIPQQSH